MKKSIYLIPLLLLNHICTACTEDETEYENGSHSDFITFTMPEEQASQETRNQANHVPNTILRACTGDSLHLSATVTDTPPIDIKETRGAQATLASLTSFGVSAAIYSASASYTTAQCGSYFFKEQCAFSTNTGYYWPSSSYKLAFYAYAPYNDSNFTVSSTATTVGSQAYAYTVPETVSQQVDVITGQVTDQLGGAQGAVELPVRHQCAAINVSFTNDGADALTVKSVSITGVKYTGTLKDNTWTLSSTVNSASSHPFTLTVNQAVAAGTTQLLTESPNIFIMMPQTLTAGAAMTITMSDDTEYMADLAGTEWVKGKTYNYVVSVNGAYEYYLEINSPDAVTYAGGSSTYGIKSYKENAGGTQLAESWTATYSTDGGETFTSTKPAWLTTFTAAGDGGTTFSNYTATVAAQSSTTQSGTPTAMLKANPTVTDYDLSLHDTQGNTTARTTANCYMVHAAGTYKIPLVYGNAIENGTLNEQAYNPSGTSSSSFLKPFLNHAGSGITAPWINKSTSGTGVNKGMGISVTGATLVWQDVQNMIADMDISGNYLTFTVSEDYIAEGNAVIAATNSDGIVWSWHVWVTNETFSNLTTITAAHTYDVTPVNLGWVNNSSSATVTGYAGRSCIVKITQAGAEGLERTFTITQNSHLMASVSTQGYNTYYQWGRKDPEIPHDGSNNSTTDHTVWSGTTVSRIYSGTSVPIATTIKNPLTHYYNSSTYGPYSSTQYNLWDATNTGTTGNVSTKTIKTIYDPCPPGFCVPTGNLFYYMSGNSGSSSAAGSWSSTSQNQGRTWTSNSPNLFFPASGYRGYSSGALYGVGSGGYCWSASPSSTFNARYVYLYSSFWRWNLSTRASAFSVRAVREE